MFSTAHKTVTRAALALATTMLASTAAATHGAAQEAVRQGFNFSVGVGSASVGATCASCQTDFFENRVGGFSGVLRIGGSLTSRLVLAAEGTGWVNNADGIDRRIAGLSAVLLGYPSDTSGFFVKAGLGGLRAIAENQLVTVQSDSWLSQLGIGMDFKVKDGLSVTAYANYLRTFGTGTWVNGVLSPEPVDPNAIQLGMAVTVH
jgi:hypothetical protein